MQNKEFQLRLILSKLSFCIILITFITQSYLAEGVLRSSVSPEFLDGLDAKFLKHIAKQMNMELEIIPLPYARRVQALKRGEIDIMVSLQEGMKDTEGFVYLQPSNESLKIGYFALKDNHQDLRTEKDLNGLSVAISIVRSEVVADNYLAKYGVKLVPVTQLQQKIDMLQKGNVDLISHYVQSTLLYLEERGLQDEIVLSSIQRPQREKYYVALSKSSPHYIDRKKFETMLSEEVKKDAFIDICKSHYNVSQRSELMQQHFCTTN